RRAHSIATGLSAIRGGLTATDGQTLSSASASSSTSGSNSMAVTFIAEAVSSATRLTTNSPVSRMLARVSLAWPDERRPTPMPITGGSDEKALKKEYGAAFNAPWTSWDTTQAIGRGTTVDTSSL